MNLRMAAFHQKSSSSKPGAEICTHCSLAPPIMGPILNKTSLQTTNGRYLQNLGKLITLPAENTCWKKEVAEIDT